MKHPDNRISKIEIDDTYAEAFDGLYCRLLITADRGLSEEDTKGPYIEFDPLRFAAYRATSTPAVVVGRTEAGIERWLPKNETPDGRDGAILQFWGMYNKKKDLKKQAEAFYKEISIRIRQDILSASGGTTRIFDWMESDKRVYKLNAEERVGKCGGGHEQIVEEHGRKIINVPLMMGHDFKIDHTLSCGIGISGANIWFFCNSVETGREVGKEAIEAIKKVNGVITSFYICPSGSMVGNYPPIGPPTNYPYCPNLKNKIKDSRVPTEVKSIPEVVIDGISLSAVEQAMHDGIVAASKVKGLKEVSAGNYGGKLGVYKIYLRNLFR